MSDAERRIGCLSKEDGRHRHVDIRPIQVETETGRNDEPDRRLRAAQPLHFLNHARQSDFGGTRAQHKQQFVPNVIQKTKNRKAAVPRNRAEHDHDEERRREVKAGHQDQKPMQCPRP